MTPVDGPLARSVKLRSAPSHRQAREIIGRLALDLEGRGAKVEMRGTDALTFRTPLPWRAPRPTWLAAASGGDAAVTAGGGGPWRVRFALHFPRLRILCLALTALLLAVGLDWARLALINAVVAVWVLYLAVGALATRTLARLVRAASGAMTERRSTPRATPAVAEGTPEGTSAAPRGSAEAGPPPA